MCVFSSSLPAQSSLSTEKCSSCCCPPTNSILQALDAVRPRRHQYCFTKISRSSGVESSRQHQGRNRPQRNTSFLLCRISPRRCRSLFHNVRRYCKYSGSRYWQRSNRLCPLLAHHSFTSVKLPVTSRLLL